MDTVINKIEPSIYVGTYEKYNNGSIAGKWLKLNDYEDISAFYKACAELHKDEHDIELMFQDFEYIPKSMIGESWLDDKFYDFLEIVNNSHIDYETYLLAIDNGMEWESLEDDYVGEFDDDVDFAIEMAASTGFIEPDIWPNNCIDWDRAARDLMYDYTEINDHYFHNS